MEGCTVRGCKNAGFHVKSGKIGRRFALLCDEHNEQYERYIDKLRGDCSAEEFETFLLAWLRN